MNETKSKILCILPICCFPTNSGSNKGKERIQQYVNGLNQFFEYRDILEKYNIDVYITDNSISTEDNLPFEILNILPPNVKIMTSLNNKFGSINKGAGLIEQWIYCKEIIEKYDWLIHFEPRQLLINFNFINNFLEKPRNLFKPINNCLSTNNKTNTHFYTGLFCIETSKLLNYCINTNLHIMTKKYISIENDLYNYMVQSKIVFYFIEKLELKWFDTTTKMAYFL